MTVNNEGQIVPNPTSDDLPLFWQKLKPVAVEGMSQPETDWWYFNRVTGNLLHERPVSTHIQGGMLCEEMGLGESAHFV